jgi:hypothetical protein
MESMSYEPNTQTEREAFLNWEVPGELPEKGTATWEIMQDAKAKIESCNHSKTRYEPQYFDGEEVTVEICNDCGATKLPSDEYGEH